MGLTRRAFLGSVGALAAGGAAWYLGRRAPNLWWPGLSLTTLADLREGEVFDVCVIGSGPAGAVLALDLAHNGLRTLVLESGPVPDDPGFAEVVRELDVYRSAGELDYPVAGSRMRAVGGTSNAWTGRSSRLHPLDFERNAYTPEGAAWPVSYAELEPYYARAERTLRVSGSELSRYHAPRTAPLPLPSPRDDSEFKAQLREFGIVADDSPTSRGRRGGGPVRASRDLLPLVTGHPLATVVAGATATRIATRRSGEVAGVDARQRDGASRTIRAGAYVVACGALESARLLLQSKSERFPAGIGNDRDLVGRFFGEHPNLTFEARAPRFPSGERTGILRCHQFYDDFKRRGLGSLILRFMRRAGPEGRLLIGATLEMRPVATNRVVLSRDRADRFGNPGLELLLSFSEDDHRTIQEARSLIFGIYEALGAPPDQIEEEPITWSHHHLGTCRMGHGPEAGVVGADLRVHGSPNLFVLGSAVFVTGGAAHPTLAITALAHRLAEQLAAELRPARGRDATAVADGAGARLARGSIAAPCGA